MPVHGERVQCQECLRLRSKIQKLKGVRDLIEWNKKLEDHFREEHDDA